MTKEEVLKKFKELDWSYKYNYRYKPEYLIYFSRNNTTKRLFEHIFIKKNKTYFSDCDIDMKTHQLLTELFKCEGWFDE